jgi:hypothetical protein
LGDLPLLTGEIVARLHAACADLLLTRRQQLCACAVGERLHPDRRELLKRRPQLLACVDAALLAAQPLAVEQVCACERASAGRERVRPSRSIAS